MTKGLVPVLLACACLGQQQMGDREGRLKAGGAAADFDLKMLHSESRVRLSSFKGQKPVALVFGSFT